MNFFGQILTLCAAMPVISQAATGVEYNVADFKSAVHQLDTLLDKRCKCNAILHLKDVKDGEDNALDFNFTVSLSDYPLRPGDDKFIRSCLKRALPKIHQSRNIGKILCEEREINELLVRHPGNDGKPRSSEFKTSPSTARPLSSSWNRPSAGLYGRHIALWNSHGRFFSNKHGVWAWQRPEIYGYREDLDTYGFVEEFLAPMLENAGAAVLIPRERDCHREELIVDNDTVARASSRLRGTVSIPAGWSIRAGGFKDYKEELSDSDPSPFMAGSYLCSRCVRNAAAAKSVKWNGNIPQRGNYAVYVCYKTLGESTSDACYVIHRLGADEEIHVNQRMGSGTWVYLGNFEFDKGDQCLVSLSNHSVQDGVVTADAVRIGGGMGNIWRVSEKGDTSGTSLVPRACEGARYFMRWSGAPQKVWNRYEGADDYKDDYGGRGPWVGWLSGGSKFNPKEPGLKIPVDLSLAFHTDAGKRPEHGIVGTLAIYTLLEEKKDSLPNNVSRCTCRELTDYVQTQVVEDIQQEWDGNWKRRPIWNRSYAESRTTKVPAVLLELLSHENFEDLKFAFDPKFRFCVARSCYKGILKYLSTHYGCNYKVQPLPVKDFRARLQGDSVILTWKENVDKLEKTAVAESFILYTRVDEGGWDKGETLRIPKGECKAIRKIEPGHVYSYKLRASNSGGVSFPSEVLSAGIGSKGKVLIINGFTRISGPSWYNYEDKGDFERSVDSGVPYIADIHAGGNTFDYVSIHGRAILKAGYSFESCSAAAFASSHGTEADCCAVDLIYGKECRYRTGTRTPFCGGCFPAETRAALASLLSRGKGLIVSGSYIASDAFHNVFGKDDNEALCDSAVRRFTEDTLGFALRQAYASKNGRASFSPDGLDIVDSSCISFPVRPCSKSYCAESPDALEKVRNNDVVYMTYSDTHLAAALFSDRKKYRTASFGFPLELVAEKEKLDRIFAETLSFVTSAGTTDAPDSEQDIAGR